MIVEGKIKLIDTLGNTQEYALEGAQVINGILNIIDDKAIVANIEGDMLTIFEAKNAKRDYKCIELVALNYSKNWEHHVYMEV